MINRRDGQLSVTMVIFSALTVVLISGFVFLAGSFLQLSVRSLNRAQAFSIAESGIEYYRWHLAHDPDDFQDGTGVSGPYVHPFYDKNGTRIGEFELEITPPPAGSTVVIVRSIGRVDADSSIQKIIQVRLAVSSLSRYALAMNGAVRFGAGTEVFGEIMSNGGIRFDGLAHNIVQSAVGSYDDPDHGGQNEFGVHTHTGTIDPLPPSAVPLRSDIFMAGRVFPVPALDFVGITQDLATIKADAQRGGYYATSSGAQGYDLELLASGSYNVYKVTAVTSPPNGCTNTSNQDGWGTWSIQSETFVASGTVPANGKMFFEDNLWVRGQVSSTRLSVGSGKFPDSVATRTSIIINENIRYTDYDGKDAIALIAQKDITVGLLSNDILRIDAALVAQNGRVGRFYYQPPNDQSNNNRCGPTVIRQKITLYGMLASNQRYGFGYTDATGYQEREIIYDTNLLYAPPPGFPLITDQYTLVSWDEIQ